MNIGKSQENSQNKKVGQILLNQKVISKRELIYALNEQKRINSSSKRKFKLGEVLLICELIELPELHKALLKQGPRQGHS